MKITSVHNNDADVDSLLGYRAKIVCSTLRMFGATPQTPVQITHVLTDKQKLHILRFS